MIKRKRSRLIFPFALLGAFALSNCSTQMVQDPPTSPPNVVGHCQGEEGVDDSSIAVIPLPVIAFFMPHSDLNTINPEDYLNRCGPPPDLANRQVTVHKGACIPASLTEIITLGIVQWCPATIAWSADVTNSPVPPLSYGARRGYVRPAPEMSEDSVPPSESAATTPPLATMPAPAASTPAAQVDDQPKANSDLTTTVQPVQ